MNRLRAIARRLRRFIRREDGGPTIEFVILVTPILWMFMSGAEAGLLNMRSVMLERGTDIAIRSVRLNPDTPPTHDQLKELICNQALLIPGCTDNLRLEMRLVPRNSWATIGAAADCVDRSEDVRPITGFLPGQANQLMLVRACVKVNPIFPTTALGLMLPKDGAGEYAVVSTAAFVNEP